MSPEPNRPGSVRSADEVNPEIRDLLVRTGGWLSADDRAVYEQLVAEWAEAVRAEVAKAA
ncbi:hypothetical protein ABT186_10990 [Streptomyces sp. NPDC001634]|uniref:hypothetical protein n=1 Tax=Streptomyces sp. NPDC001634 TaxID=3154390 RepID=UPI003327F5F5